jgi:cytochrome c-type biogenesis protein CcmH/NrfG
VNTTAYTADVYISYAGNDGDEAFENSRDQIIQKISELLEQNNLKPKQYKTDVQYKDSVDKYKLDIAYGDYVILVVSEKYLKSEYCMNEAVALLNRNQRGLEEKIFPLVLKDADIFNWKKKGEYIDYWHQQITELDNYLANKDQKAYISLTEQSINFREIYENIGSFIKTLAGICEPSKKLIEQNNYQVIIETIIKQIEQNRQLQIPVQATAPQQGANENILYPQILGSSSEANNIAALAKASSDVISKITNKVDEIILDSEKAKKEFIDINFDEISSDKEISPATQNFIFSLRKDKTKYEPYRQSLIISALSLGLIKQYDETKALMLIDLAKDDDPVLSYRALTGLVLALIDKEDYISAEIQQKLETLRDNSKIQTCLVNIFYFIGNVPELQKIAQALHHIDYSKFEFFNKTQNWFLPFYETNPVLKENVTDKKLAKGLVNAILLLGLDSSKYALALLYPSLSKEEIDDFKSFCVQDENLANSFDNNTLKSKFLLGIEVSKYLLEFYIYALNRKDDHIINVIEDAAQLRKGSLFKTIISETYQNIFSSSQLLIKQQYKEAAEAVKPVLDELPNNIEALLLYGQSNYYAQNYNDTIPSLEKIIVKGIQEKQVIAMLGDSYFNTQNYPKAIEFYSQLLLLQHNTEAIINIGRSYQLQQQPDDDKALEYYLQAYKSDASNYYNLLFIGDIYLKQTPQHYAKAFEYYHQAFIINDKDVALLKALTGCAVNLPELDFETSTNIFKKHIEAEPANPLPYMALGDRLVNSQPKDYENAFNYYEQAFAIDSNNIALIKMLAECINNLPEVPLETREKILLKWIELEPGTVYPYLALGDCYWREDPPLYTKAFEYYYKGFTLDETNLDVIKRITDCIYELETVDADKAFHLFKKFIELEPGNASAYNGMGYAYSLKIPPDYVNMFNNYYCSFEINPIQRLIEILFTYAVDLPQPDEKKINKLYESYKKLEPASAKADWMMGDFYANKMKPDTEKAALFYTNALNIDPLNKELLLSVGKFYQLKQQPDYEQSFHYLHEIIKQDADDIYANLYLGWGNFTAGNYSEAKKYFERCRGKGTDEHMICQNLGHIAFIEKDTSAAKELYKKSYALFKDKEAFYTAGIDDWKYLENSGADKDEFMQLLKEAALP